MQLILKPLFIVSCLILIFLGYLSYADQRRERPQKQFEALSRQRVQLGQCQIELSIARSPAQQRRGLSLLPGLADDRGLAFPQTSTRRPSFWMKAMRFSIDLIWLNQGQVIAIEPNLVPDDGQKIYPAPQPVDLIIELAAGRAAECQIKPDSPLLYPS